MGKEEDANIRKNEKKTWDKRTNGDSKKMRLKSNCVKTEQSPLASLGLKLHLTALERRGISSDSSRGFVALHLQNMARNPIIPGSGDARAPSPSLIPRHRGYGSSLSKCVKISRKKIDKEINKWRGFRVFFCARVAL